MTLFRKQTVSAMLGLSILMAGTAFSPVRAETPDTIPAWLNDINGARAMDWVKAQNARTLARLGQGTLYKSLYDSSLELLETHDRLAMPMQVDGQIYNFWRDETHRKGILRRSTQATYDAGKPEWTTVFDLDALAAKDKKDWVWHGMNCLQTSQNLCLFTLSEGGEDASTIREFDLRRGDFVPGGFTLPRAKQGADWLDKNTLLVSRPWAPDDVTSSSYPYIVKAVSRGEPLSKAKTIFAGPKSDMEIVPEVFWDGDGHHVAIINDAVSIFSARNFVYVDGKTEELSLPRKADITGLYRNRLIVYLHEDWSVYGLHFAAGSVVLVDPTSKGAPPTLVIAPGPKQVVEGAEAAKDKLIVTLYDNVRGRMLVLTPQGAGFLRKDLALPANISVDAVGVNAAQPTAYAISTGFLTPSTLWRIDVESAAVTKVRSLPAQFDATDLTVEQLEARSKDGTEIPYFAVHRKDLPLNGTNPTLLYAYGGFEVPLFPSYSAAIGRNWLARGGVYVQANIRGGGEFGPAWHEAGLKTNRQRIYDDFAAVAQDLFTRKITSSGHLAIQGGSNGGLLMGVEFTQHPEMWRAVDIEVPLLDMVNFEHMSAGASWTGEYGTNAIPEQRAFLRRISPLQNLKPDVKYPEPFIETTTKDDRVGPVHARRFAWRLNELNVPYYYWEQTAGGHGFGASQTEIAQTEALSYAYLWKMLGTRP